MEIADKKCSSIKLVDARKSGPTKATIQNKKSKQGRPIGRWVWGDSSGSSLSPLTPTGRGRENGTPL